MDKRMQAGIADATRLTRAGRLMEATAVIQRTLGGMLHSNAAPAKPSGSGGPGAAQVRNPVDSSPSSAPSRATSRGRMPFVRRAAGRHSAKAPSRLGMAWRRLLPHGLQLPGSTRPTRGTRSARPATPDAGFSSVHTRGQFVQKTYTNRAGSRSYHLYIPRRYRGQALPLVIMLHGCTQRATDFAAGTRMNVRAEGETFFVAYPEQARSANRSKCWNWFHKSNQHREEGEPSLIAGITRQIMSDYHVDGRRVYVAGISAGGAMAAIMAATYPDLYAAVGVHSGIAYGAAHNLPSALAAMKRGTTQDVAQLAGSIPLIVFHGDADTTVTSNNADRLVEQWIPGGSAEHEQEGAWRSEGGRRVKVKHGQVVNGHAYTRSIYLDSRGRPMVEQWIVHRAGHAWSGGSPDGSFTDPKGPDASTEMIRFFTEHPKRR